MTKRYVSVSEIDKFSFCREAWKRSYDQKLSTFKRIEQVDVGIIGHEAIQAIILGKDPYTAMNVWVAIQKKRYIDSIDEDEIGVDLDNALSIARDIIPRYIKKFENDDWTPIIVEEMKEVLLFTMPEYDIEVWWKGKIDAVIKDNVDGLVWMVENKFPMKRNWLGDFGKKTNDLILDFQIGTYEYMGNRLGIPIAGTLYQQILGQKLTLPKLKFDRKGEKLLGVSTDKSMNCDWETYRDYVTANGFDVNDKEYIGMETALTEKEFIKRDFLYKSPEMIESFGQNFKERAYYMLKDIYENRIYRETNRYNCGFCDFKKICEMEMNLEDPSEYINETFRKGKK